MRNSRTRASVTAFLLALALTAPVLADPPAHAPAHGWRAKHDPYYTGYTGHHWDRDYGILDGRCDREAVGTVLGGVIGGVTGSRIGDAENRTVAIIIGTAVGALIGRRIGRELDEADRGCIGHALEVGKPGQVVTWVNDDTGIEYQMALGPADSEIGDSCRSYSLLGIAGGKKAFRKGIACQSEPGVWKIIEAART